MNVQIKKAVKAGNSSAVVLPRAWLGKEVRVEIIRKSQGMILLEVIEILMNYISLENVIGIYLIGSYARGEEENNSDIDVLVISSECDEIINEGVYSIFVVSEGVLKEKLERDLFPIGQMIKEAKALLNSDYIDSINVRVSRKNIKWYLDTTKDKLDLIKKIIDLNKEKVDCRVGYTLVLRLRTLYIIKKLIENEDYMKEEFVGLVRKVSGGNNAYNCYLNIKNNGKNKSYMNMDEVKRMYDYLKDFLKEVQGLLRD